MSYVLLMSMLLWCVVTGARRRHVPLPLFATSLLLAGMLLVADMTSPLTLTW